MDNFDANLDDIPLPPPATDQPAQRDDRTFRPINDTTPRNEQLNQFYHDGYNGYSGYNA
ncbi:hypothetical protein AAVH_42557, partial [Aphelenchoides avenae]